MGSDTRSRRAFLGALAGGVVLWLLGDHDSTDGAYGGGGGAPVLPDTRRIAAGETYTVRGYERYAGVEICPGGSLCIGPGDEIGISAEAL